MRNSLLHRMFALLAAFVLLLGTVPAARGETYPQTAYTTASLRLRSRLVSLRRDRTTAAIRSGVRRRVADVRVTTLPAHQPVVRLRVGAHGG